MKYQHRIKALEEAAKYDPERFEVIYLDGPEDEKRAAEEEEQGKRVIRVEYV